MLATTATIDEGGRLALPPKVLDALHIGAGQEVVIELTDAGLLVAPKRSVGDITRETAAMSLPVADWEEMGQQIEAG